ncbi:uncharacterized protein LOC121265845 [Juglans microcarpa x Juglans regia]|uniref:uncharacterized protein LOC121265845 n=1 Tax=Juglans microcarpa x Juglans regia TaxID=2249226 RepID=UPI001B7EB544|nr:uncharacterized protein LOC121265845 [Juglans microcarpa x Juglans regia]
MSNAKPKIATKAKVYAIMAGEVDLEAGETADAGVITGMHWLSGHYSQIDCPRREVVINLPARERICYMGETIRLDLSTVTAKQVKKSLVNGDNIYLVMMMDVMVGPKEIQGISVIEDFPRVFTDELPRLPLDRETEFVIELEPATTPVHKALYQMAPAELKELKV